MFNFFRRKVLPEFNEIFQISNEQIIILERNKSNYRYRLPRNHRSGPPIKILLSVILSIDMASPKLNLNLFLRQFFTFQKWYSVCGKRYWRSGANDAMLFRLIGTGCNLISRYQLPCL